MHLCLLPVKTTGSKQPDKFSRRKKQVVKLSRKTAKTSTDSDSGDDVHDLVIILVKRMYIVATIDFRYKNFVFKCRLLSLKMGNYADCTWDKFTRQNLKMNSGYAFIRVNGPLNHTSAFTLSFLVK